MKSNYLKYDIIKYNILSSRWWHHLITIIITLCNNSSDCNSKTLSNDVTQGRNEGMNSRGCKFCSSHVIRQTWKNRRQQSNNKTSENPTKFQKIDIKSDAIANFFKKSRGATPPHPPLLHPLLVTCLTTQVRFLSSYII